MSGYLLMIAYCIGESIGHQTCNHFRTIWIIYFSGNKTGKWSSIPTSVSFYVSPTKRNPFARDYDIHGRKLEEVELAKYLGVTIQKNLSWNIHIDQITKKANSTRAFIQRNLNHCPREMKSTCYLTLVRPLLGYACMVWDPHTAQNTHKLEAVQRRSNTHKLEAVQRRSASFVMNNYQQTSSITSMLHTLQWPTLAERRVRISYDDVQDSEWPSSYTTNRATHIYNSKRPYSKIHSPVCQNHYCAVSEIR